MGHAGGRRPATLPWRVRMARVLVIFDVDGTLTRTSDIDASLYAQAFFDTFGFPLPTLDWTAYRYATDRGIAEEALRRAGHGRANRSLDDMRRRFIEMLDEALPPDATHQVAGAGTMFDRLRQDGHAIAIATGCWENSARLKLARSLIEIGECPLVACDEEPDRVAILRCALERAGFNQRHAVYVGDGPWDVRAAQRLRLPFIGIDHNSRGRLRALGIRTVLADFRDYRGFLANTQGRLSRYEPVKTACEPAAMRKCGAIPWK